MENIFRNDLKEGNKSILKLVEQIKAPLRQRVISQAIFQHTYPSFFKRESFSTIALLSLYLAGKMSENIVKLNVLIDLGKVKLEKQRLFEIECRMVEMIDFNFDIVPAHMYLFKISKALGIEINDKLQALDEIHNDSRLNYVNYFNGLYEPLLVALSIVDDTHINTIECVYSIKIDPAMVSEVRRVLFKM